VVLEQVVVVVQLVLQVLLVLAEHQQGKAVAQAVVVGHIGFVDAQVIHIRVVVAEEYFREQVEQVVMGLVDIQVRLVAQETLLVQVQAV
jgi:hypothetical protein